MATKIFINLPVADLQRALTFYTTIRFANNLQFTDDTAACMVLSEEIYVMLLTHTKFNEFTKKAIGDASRTASVINTLSLDSTEEVNTMVGKAIEAGGVEPSEARDYGFMQSRSFEDLDGHFWGVNYMDLSKLPQQ